MPIYEYQCSSCGHELDELQKIADDPLVDCPQCGRPTLVKLVSAPNFRLKGSGWYETDFKKDKRKNLADDGGKPDEASGGDKKGKDKSDKSDAPAAKKSKTKDAKSTSSSKKGSKAADS